MKPHEETWMAVQSEWVSEQKKHYSIQGDSQGQPVYGEFYEWTDQSEARARLAACAPEMARILFEIMFTRQVALFEDQADRIGDLLKKAGVL